MLFLLLLMTAALSIAGSAAFFSVFGLANTFHGTFWAVIVMGGSLEFGKLMATSFLYRYWYIANKLLKCVLVILIISLMILTSTGIFGFLSTGYQTDAISFKQIEQKVALLDSEKARLIERKQQIDNQIASLPTDTARGRINLINGFKEEQQKVTNRLDATEVEEVDVKTKLIQSEAHVGPVMYIAKALKLDTDDATKYLIYLIIFIFDPMAVTLTLAVNIVLQERSKNKSLDEHINIGYDKELMNNLSIDEEPMQVNEEPIQVNEEPMQVNEEPIQMTEEEYIQLIDISNAPQYSRGSLVPTDENLDFYVEHTDEIIHDPNDVATLEVVDTQSNILSPLEQMVKEYHQFKARIDSGERLSLDDHWKYTSIRDSLQSQGFNVYI